LVLAIAMLLSVLLAGEAFAQRAAGRQWRWDLIQIGVGMTALAGGTDTSRDAATGETISLTGSGQFRPSARTASGGGTFVHKRADGTEVAHGVYIVSSFRNFRLGGGTPPPVTDGILTPRLGTPQSGVLRLGIRLVPDVNGKPGPARRATLRVFCHFKGNRLGLEESDEGIQLGTGNLHFRQVEGQGFTVFHVLR
jgi:hypothetical protein